MTATCINGSLNTVSAIAVLDLAQELFNLSCISHTQLSDLGDHFNTLYNAWQNNKAIQEERLPEFLLIKLWDEASKSDQIPDLGLLIGRKVNLKARGILATWLFQCDSLTDAFETFNKNIHLLNSNEVWVRSNCGDDIKLTHHFKSEAYPVVAAERSMAAAVAWGSALTDCKVTPTQANFTRMKPECTKRYHEIFGENVVFASQENSVCFPKEIFDSSIRDPNPFIRMLVEEKANEISSSLSSRSSVTEKVNSLLCQNLKVYCHVQAVCEALNQSRSTLYRKLKLEGSNYSELVKIARKRTLDNNKSESISHGDLAESLGFRDVSSYYRFCKDNKLSKPFSK